MEASLNALFLWSHGARFAVPPRAVAYGGAPPNSSKGGGEAVTAKLGSVRSRSEFEAYVGVRLKDGVAHPRATTGLSPQPTMQESVVKYGSRDEAIRALVRADRWSTA